MIRLIPITKYIDAPGIARLFKYHIYRHSGLPQKIISDRDSLLISKFWKSLFKLLSSKRAPSAAYHSQTDGQTKIANRKGEEMKTAIANLRKNNWDEYLFDFEVAYNSSVHATISFSSFYLAYGLDTRTVPSQNFSSDNPSVASFLETIQETTKFGHEKFIRII